MEISTELLVNQIVKNPTTTRNHNFCIALYFHGDVILIREATDLKQLLLTQILSHEMSANVCKECSNQFFLPPPPPHLSLLRVKNRVYN